MSNWRRRAIELLPDLKPVIEHADSPMALWIELQQAAARAFEARPVDEKTVRAIFAFARHSWASPNADLTTAVVVAFFENIVTSAAARADLHRWISQAEFDGLEEPFRYHLSAEQFSDFAEQFRRAARSTRPR